MASAADLRELEDLCPWTREDFQADLAALALSTQETARRFAADAVVLARLAGQVPRCPHDDRGATPWTSFRREVAVARSCSDQAAAAEIRIAVRLTTCLPRTFALLVQGRVTVPRARAFVTELEVLDDEVATALDAQLAERVAALPVWRIVQEVRRAALVTEPEAAALRIAAANADRSVELQPQADDQALVLLQGPAVPLTRWYEALDSQARALKQAGDPRTLGQLRFDLASSVLRRDAPARAPADPPADAAASESRAPRLAGTAPVTATTPPDAGPAAAGLRLSHMEAAVVDCRLRRPVQAHVTVPVETALGLSNEPAWLDGYGWISAPTARLLLVDAELRRVCVRTGTGEVVDVADRDVRPPPTPQGLRDALVQMVTDPLVPADTAHRVEHQHDPSPPLRALVALRDRYCDGPTGARVPARRAELDHDTAYPVGPTAAWNLRARSQRTHQLKHRGWTPLRTPTSTIWFSPAGQVVEVPDQARPAPGVDGAQALPPVEELAEVDAEQLQPGAAPRPWLPAFDRSPDVAWLPGSAPLPF